MEDIDVEQNITAQQVLDYSNMRDACRFGLYIQVLHSLAPLLVPSCRSSFLQALVDAMLTLVVLFKTYCPIKKLTTKLKVIVHLNNTTI